MIRSVDLRSIVSWLARGSLVASRMLLAARWAALPTQVAAAQTAADAPLQISWEVRNRFRLFREERDFLLHVESVRDRSILASEQALELQSDGRGWARNMVNRLCIDLQGRVSEPCTRDNVKESYLTPIDHPIVVRLDRRGPGRRHLRLVVRRRRRPAAAIDLRLRRAGQSSRPLRPPDGRDRRRLQRAGSARSGSRPRSGCATSSSPASATASPPAKAIRTGRSRSSDEGFCFRYYLGSAAAQYYRPSRAGYKGGRACEAPDYAAELAALRRALAQLRLPSFALQLPDPHRARARRAISAHRRHLSAARLHRRHHRRRIVRQPARARMSAEQVERDLLRAASTASLTNCATR